MQITAFFKSYKLDNIIEYMDKITFILNYKSCYSAF